MTEETTGVTVATPAPEVMACRHAISAARVAEWWRRHELRQERGPRHARDVSICGCCTGPVYAVEVSGHEPYFPSFCRPCNREPAVQPWLPYGEASS